MSAMKRGGYLTEAIRRRPYSVVLLDEVEKAHPDVFNVLLQVLDDGRLTDGQGRTVDFRNTVIVMTSNLGSQVIQEISGEEHYQEMKAAVMETVRQNFRPEFINRLDEIVVFHPLASEQIRAIAKIQIDYLHKRLSDHEMGLMITDAAPRPAGRGRFRSCVWRPTAETGDPAAAREPAGPGDPGGPLRAWGYHRGG